ncbi:autophagy-related protein 22 [Myxozyma melibiosi]|uniref:Autophagy-related protein n=1 Tax=Myxozyma melibiosi TaxID=54550 RepID=A0ABR1F8M6_9ASCO
MAYGYHPLSDTNGDQAANSTAENEASQPREREDDELTLRPIQTSFSTYSQLDSRSTSKKEILGWLSFAFATEPFTVAAVSVYLPILLEQYARDNSVLTSDHSVLCHSESTNEAGDGGVVPIPGDSRCVVSALGIYVDPASFALYTFSISVFLQAVVVISMSGAADRGHYRKRLLLAFSCLGGISAMLLITAVSKAYYFAAFLTILGNISFGAVAVCGNAFLPVLVRNHPDIMDSDGDNYSTLESPAARGSTSSSVTLARTESSDSPVLPKPAGTGLGSTDQEEGQISFESFPLDTVEPESRQYFDHQLSDSEAEKAAEVSSKLSGLGIASGYLSAFIVQTVGIIIVAAMGSSSLSIRLVLFLIGVWWLVFTIPVALFMRPRPGPKMHMNGKDSELYQYVVYGWRTIWKTAKEVRKLRDVGLYLAGWFILSDSATTINATAILFARTELNMAPAALAIVGIITMVFGMIGAVVFSRYVQQYLMIPPNKVIVIIVAVTALIPAYGLLGFMTDKLGLHHAWEIYLLAAVYGMSLGGMSSVCRSVFSMLIPPGKESTFFSLYAVTDKGSSIVGPTVTAMITDRTHNIRYTFYFLFLLLLLSIPIFYYMDVERGKRDAQRFNENTDAEERTETGI